ncbi:MAG TPA: hypothetical protein PKU97_02535 [Kofleriaceae bacterium]|nr:hypothetical protein [Kofleriaceae bacterium]
MSRSLERRKRQDNRAQRRSQDSADTALSDQLDQLGKRTMAQVEGSSRRGFANLSQLPQQLFADLESTIGDLDSQPRVKTAIGKLTEVMEAAANLKPLHLDDIEARNKWVPDDLKDDAHVAERERTDDHTNRDRLQTIAKVANTNDTQVQGEGRRQNPLAKRLRGVMGNFELAANLTDTISDIGITGFEQGAAAATAAIGGSLQDLMRAASETLSAHGVQNGDQPTTAPAADVGKEGQLAPQPRGEVAEPTATADVMRAGAVTDQLAQEHAEEQQADGDEEAVALEEPAQAAQGADAEGPAASVQMGAGGLNINLPGANLSVGAGGVTLQGAQGSLQLGANGISGSLQTGFGAMSVGPGGLSADLAMGGANLHVGSDGMQLGVQSPMGSVSVGSGGVQLITAAGSVQAGAGGVHGHLENLGGFSGAPGPAGLPASALGLPASALGLPASALGGPQLPGPAGLPASALGLPASALGGPQAGGDLTARLTQMGTAISGALGGALEPMRNAVSQVGGMITTAVEQLSGARPAAPACP